MSSITITITTIELFRYDVCSLKNFYQKSVFFNGLQDDFSFQNYCHKYYNNTASSGSVLFEDVHEETSLKYSCHNKTIKIVFHRSVFFDVVKD